MYNHKATPAYAVIHKLGGYQAVADAVGCARSAVYRWTYDQPHGTGGSIPSGKIKTLLRYANENGIDLTPADFFDVSHNAGAGSAKSAAAAGEKSREIAGGCPHA